METQVQIATALVEVLVILEYYLSSCAFVVCAYVLEASDQAPLCKNR
jgi:hypothetical protein